MIVPTILALALLQQPAAVTQPAQSAQPAQTTQPAGEQSVPHGKVLFERHESEGGIPSSSTNASAESDKNAAAVPDALRLAFTVSGYEIDLHLNYATAIATMRAQMVVTNHSSAPVTSVPISVSSSMHWQSIHVHHAGQALMKAAFEEHSLATDADHTGRASEAWVKLAEPLAPGESIIIDGFYEGPLTEDATRLTAVGAPQAQASASEWDGFNFAAPASGVRGFGNVLWYPVVAPAFHLGEGNKLFQAIAGDRAHNADVAFRLRLTVESMTPLTAAFFCGEMQPLRRVSSIPTLETGDGVNTEAQKLPASDTAAVYTAEWKRDRIGVRTPSLFIATASAVPSESGLLDAYTTQPDAVPAYNAAAVAVRPVMEAWLGARPQRKLILLDLGARAALPFEDENLIALPMHTGNSDILQPAMVEWLTHAYFRADEQWMTDGLAAFMGRVWAEHEARAASMRVGNDRDAALALALYESATPAASETTSSSSSGNNSERPPLTRCADPVCYRTKGAAVWRMLRFLAGESALQQAMQAFRDAGGSSSQFESLLEKTSGKDLGWFFDEWVFHDRGLPDLSIVAVSPRPVTSTTSSIAGKGSKTASPAGQQTRETGGWLVAVEVSNEGDATAQVPVTLRGNGFNSTEPMRILPHSRATMRMLVPGKPTEVQVNDGTVPEIRADSHVLAVQVKTTKE